MGLQTRGIVLLLSLHTFSARGKVRTQTSCNSMAAKILPVIRLARSKQDPIGRGHQSRCNHFVPPTASVAKKVNFLYTGVWQHHLCGYNLDLLCLDGGSKVQIHSQHPVRRMLLGLAYLAIDAVIGIGWDCPDEVGGVYQLHVRSLGNSTDNKYKCLC